MVKIFKEKGDKLNCSCYRDMKILQHDMMMVGRVMRDCTTMIIKEMQFDFILVKQIIDTVFILIKLQEECHTNI